VNVRISGAEHLPPDQVRVPELMESFITWYQTEAMALHPWNAPPVSHSDFVKIHPFVDGNGRTSRLLMNLELMKAGYPPAVLPVECATRLLRVPGGGSREREPRAFHLAGQSHREGRLPPVFPCAGAALGGRQDVK